jgi:hypothetical protein
MCCQRYSRSSWLTALLPCPAHACSTMKIAVALAICLLLATEASCRRTLAGDDITPTRPDKPTGKAGPTAAGLEDWWWYGNFCGKFNGCSRDRNMLPCYFYWGGVCISGPKVDYPDCWSAPPVDSLDAACRQHDSCLTFTPAGTRMRTLCHRNLANAAKRCSDCPRGPAFLIATAMDLCVNNPKASGC